ncbi:hypothetical protein FOL47_006258 [Perkinsus chesapeaki]|uniref:Enolase C-terminal domain-containing protein n=1 Tax=Perkinsus chesapeaki TaxID=330153 RepID=A0A7J6LSX6_PERCH|nr:hypothetical protein FOL47_006258 [Perkinsus chesapeaki]
MSSIHRGQLEVLSIQMRPFCLPLRRPLPLCRGNSKVEITEREGTYMIINCRFHPADGSASCPCSGVGESCPLPLFHPKPCFEPIVTTPTLPRFIDFASDGISEACRAACRGNISVQGALEMALLGCISDFTGKRPSEVLWWYGGGVAEDLGNLARTVKINQMFTREERTGAALLRGCVKLKVGDDPIADAKTVSSAAEGVSESGCLRLDANQSWTPDQYELFTKSLSDVVKAKIEYIEEPTTVWCDDYISFGIPTAMDESLVTATKFPACGSPRVHFVLKPGVLGLRRACQYVVRFGSRCCLSSMFESSLSMYWYTALASLCDSQVYHGLSTSSWVLEEKEEGRSFDDLIKKDGLWLVDLDESDEALKATAQRILCSDRNDSTSVAHVGTPLVGSGIKAEQAYNVSYEAPTPGSGDANSTASGTDFTRQTELEELRKSRKRYREEAIRLRAQVRDTTIRQGQLAQEAKFEESARRAAERRAAELHEEMKSLRMRAQESREEAIRSDRLRQEAVQERDRCKEANQSLIEYSRKLRTMVQELRGKLKVNYAALKAIQDAADELSLITKNAAVSSSSVDDLMQPIPPSPPSPMTAGYSDGSATDPGADNVTSTEKRGIGDPSLAAEPQSKKMKQEDELARPCGCCQASTNTSAGVLLTAVVSVVDVGRLRRMFIKRG